MRSCKIAIHGASIFRGRLHSDWRLYCCCWGLRLLLFLVDFLVLILVLNLDAIDFSTFDVGFALVAWFLSLVLFALRSCYSSFHVSSAEEFESTIINTN